MKLIGDINTVSYYIAFNKIGFDHLNLSLTVRLLCHLTGFVVTGIHYYAWIAFFDWWLTKIAVISPSILVLKPPGYIEHHSIEPND
jgi:hypothetical protein